MSNVTLKVCSCCLFSSTIRWTYSSNSLIVCSRIVGFGFSLLLSLFTLLLVFTMLSLLNIPGSPGDLPGGGSTVVGSVLTYKNWCGAAN